MKHYIAIRFNDKVIDKSKTIADLTEFFKDSAKLKGLSEYKVSSCCVKLPNRFDCLITLTFDSVDSLMSYDESSFHRDFKKEFGPYFSTKVIFDEE